MANGGSILCFAALLQSIIAVRINFTPGNCQHPEWSCLNNSPYELVYSGSAERNDSHIIHIKDFYTDHITSLTVQNCKDLRVVLDCPILQRSSQLRKLILKDCDKLEFVTLSSNSLLQTPPEVSIENVMEIVTLPRNIFKSPGSNTELKCLGATSINKIRIVNSHINSINTKAIYNVTGIKSIEFVNVTISEIQTQAIEAIMNGDRSAFTIAYAKVDNLARKAITVLSNSATLSDNNFDVIMPKSLNITSNQIHVVRNRFKEITANGLIVEAVNIEITGNEISLLKSDAFANIKCSQQRILKKQLSFVRNKITTVEPNSLTFDYASCKSAGATVLFTNNKLDCTCRNIAFLNSAISNVDLNSLILNVDNNNTCLAMPCLLPVEVVKLLMENNMCQLNVDPQVTCLLYNDKHSNMSANNEVTLDDNVTEPALTFYLIRQASSPNGDASAAMTAVNKDDLLKDSHLNMTNRTTIKVVFDSSRDFVETLRSTSSTHNRPVEVSKTPVRDHGSHCSGSQCRNTVAYDKQKALDFYKYVYAQLRPPR